MRLHAMRVHVVREAAGQALLLPQEQLVLELLAPLAQGLLARGLLVRGLPVLPELQGLLVQELQVQKLQEH